MHTNLRERRVFELKIGQIHAPLSKLNRTNLCKFLHHTHILITLQFTHNYTYLKENCELLTVNSNLYKMYAEDR